MPQIEESAEDLDKLFDKPIEQNVPRKMSINEKDKEIPNTISEEYTKNINWNVGNEKIIKRCLLLGDLESAVQLLFKNNRNCEALLIASCKDELFKKQKKLTLQKKMIYLSNQFSLLSLIIILIFYLIIMLSKNGKNIYFMQIHIVKIKKFSLILLIN